MHGTAIADGSAMKTIVQAQHLKPGDFLIATKRVVYGVSIGARTPAGKVEVNICIDETGRIRTSEWRKSTLLLVERGTN